MINLYYFDELGRKINYSVIDLEAVYVIADMLLKAPIDVLELYYQDNTGQGIFNLATFERS